MRDASDESVPLRAMLALRSGGWVLLVALLIGILIVVFTLAPALQRIAARPPGDGQDPATYGFALEPSAPGLRLIPAQLHRDMASPLVEPPALTPADVAAWTEENRGKYLVSSDPVVGVVAGEEARAFPLGWMAFHEVANDVLDGVPVLVVMHPLSRTIAVYDRRAGDRTIEFGTSGLLQDGTMLLYARERDETGAVVVAEGGESLWDPRTGRAITGPDLEAGLRLERLPFVLTHYGDWLDVHPKSTILARDEDLVARYEKATFERYWDADEVLYPVAADPPMPPRRLEACVVLPGEGEGADVVVPASWIDRAARRPMGAAGAGRSGGGPDGNDAGAAGPGPDGDVASPAGVVRTWWITVDDRVVGLQYRDDPETVTAIGPDGEPLVQVQTAWYSWWLSGRPVRFPEPPRGLELGGDLASFDAAGARDADASER